MNIFSIFPTPVGMFKLGRDLTDGELSYLMGLEMSRNQGNFRSVESQVLDHESMVGLRTFIKDCVDQFFKVIYCPNDDVSLRLTQSWTNNTKPFQHHHSHTHQNAFVSGVFYVKANAESDKIHFYRNIYQQIEVAPTEFNLHNSRSWWFGIGTGDLILFPSSLGHEVKTVQGEDVRVSLAFNTFPVGRLGDESNLNKLIIENLL